MVSIASFTHPVMLFWFIYLAHPAGRSLVSAICEDVNKF